MASGRTSEIKLEIATDEKENEFAVETVQNEVDAFDLSPSGQRAVISARGQILTIATNRGDITRVMPDAMASRNQNPKWSPDGKYLAFVSDKSGRDEIWISDPEGLNPKKITDLDNEKGPIVWTPDSKFALYTTADRRLYGYSVADGKTMTIATGDVGRIGNFSVSPDSKWVAFSKQDKTLRNHVYIVPITGGEARHISDDRVQYSETNAVWTADGRYLVFIVAETASNGIATQGGIATTMSLWAVSLRDQDRDPMNRDVDNEAQGLAAEAAARGRGAGGGGGGAAATPPTVTIDWNNLARRARQVPVPGDNLGGLVASPTANTVVLTVGAGGGRGGGRGGAPDATCGSLHRQHRHRADDARAARCRSGWGGGGGRGRGAAAAGGGGRRYPGLHARRPHAVLPIRHRALRLHAAGRPGRRRGRGSSAGGRWRRRRGQRGGGAEVQAPRRRRDDRRRAAATPGDVHRDDPGRSPRAPEAGLQRRLAHHEEPLLRRRDAHGQLGRRCARSTSRSSTSSSIRKSCSRS